MRSPVDVWLDEVWERTDTVHILAGGEDGGPLADRTLLGWIDDPDDLARLRELSRTGAFTGSVCRCHGSLTLGLCDTDGELVGHASLHGTDTIAWNRARFRDDLEMSDPLGLALLLARNGETRPLTRFSSQLARALGLQEGRPQFREPGRGRHGAALLERRHVPFVVRPELTDISGREAAELPEDQVEGLRELLAAHHPEPDALAIALLVWLGSLPDPMEAEFGEGVLVRRLLDRLSPLAAVRGLPQPLDGDVVLDGSVALGVMRWARHHKPQEPSLADLLGPCLRKLIA